MNLFVVKNTRRLELLRQALNASSVVISLPLMAYWLQQRIWQTGYSYFRIADDPAQAEYGGVAFASLTTIVDNKNNALHIYMPFLGRHNPFSVHETNNFPALYAQQVVDVYVDTVKAMLHLPAAEASLI